MFAFYIYNLIQIRESSNKTSTLHKNKNFRKFNVAKCTSTHNSFVKLTGTVLEISSRQSRTTGRMDEQKVCSLSYFTAQGYNYSCSTNLRKVAAMRPLKIFKEHISWMHSTSTITCFVVDETAVW